jgi:HAD superfamily hydrolase (TIGR01490 family)
MKKAAFFDVDGTLTHQRVWQGLIDYFNTHRLRRGTYLVFQVYHYALYFLYLVKLIPQVGFRALWAEHLSWLFRGFSIEQATVMWDWVVTERVVPILRPEILAELNQHKRSGDIIFLVSGGPEGLLERIAQEVGADYAIGTRHEIKNGVYTGRSASAACQGESKAAFSRNKIAELGLKIDLSSSFAYADSGGDVAMLSMVGNPVAVFPDDDLRMVAVQRKWKVID